MSHYKSNLRDVEFNLFEVLKLDEQLGQGVFAEVDPSTARSFLRETERLASTVLAESFADSDRNPPVFDPATHSVTLPEPFRRAYAAWMESGMYQLGLDPDLGGVTAPHTLIWALSEFVLGANPAVFMYGGGPSFA